MSLKEKISRSADAFLNVHAQNLPLQFYTSTLNGLVDLVEDEIIPTPIPMEVLYIIFSHDIMAKSFYDSRLCVLADIVYYLNPRFTWKTLHCI